MYSSVYVRWVIVETDCGLYKIIYLVGKIVNYTFQLSDSLKFEFENIFNSCKFIVDVQ